MRIFFIIFAFIASVSIYPRVIPLFLSSDDVPFSAQNTVAFAKEDENIGANNTVSYNKTTAPSIKSYTNTKMSQMTQNGHSMKMQMYKDGAYKGATKDAYYGYVQVKVIIQNNKIVDIKFLKFPSNNRNSLYLSNISLPSLKKEVIQAQNEKVDVISGATYTSLAFIKSTKSALLKALN